MASLELETAKSDVVREAGDGGGSKKKKQDLKENRMMNKKKKNKNGVMRIGFRCFRMERDEKGNFDMEAVDSFGERRDPTHLLIMANGLIGSAENWKFAAKQFLKRSPEDLIVHCSECNRPTLTFDGVDRMGGRLAEEVLSVIKRHPNLQKISFIGHSLGGLVARYAIAKLYRQEVKRELSQGNGECRNNDSGDSVLEEKFTGKIAGLEPVNFITVATPHLGSRGHKQVPLFCGSYALEKAASRTSWFLGRTGKHLFLTDRDNGKPPLLLRMAMDCEDLKFLSALQCFRRHVAYANVRFDHLVGWSTSSLRRAHELPKRRHLLRDSKYPHIVKAEAVKITSSHREEPLKTKEDGRENIDMEEEMLRGLTRLSWERVDVNFSGSKQKFLAHTTIQVKTYCINYDGADVIQHMIDNFVL